MKMILMLLSLLTYSYGAMMDCEARKSCPKDMPNTILMFENHLEVATSCYFSKDTVLAFERVNDTVVIFDPPNFMTAYNSNPVKCRHNIQDNIRRAYEVYKRTGDNYIAILEDGTVEIMPEGMENDVQESNHKSTKLTEDVKQFIRHVYIDNFEKHTDEDMLRYIDKNVPYVSNVDISAYFYNLKRLLVNKIQRNVQPKVN